MVTRPVLFSVSFLSLYFYLFFSLYFYGCSHPIPDFKPEPPPEKARTYIEAVESCSRYEITEVDKPAARLSVIIPWSRCLEDTIRYHPDSREYEPLVMLFHELSRIENRYKNLEARVIDPDGMNIVMRAVFEFLKCDANEKNTQGCASKLEPASLKQMKKHLPGFYDYFDTLLREKVRGTF